LYVGERTRIVEEGTTRVPRARRRTARCRVCGRSLGAINFGMVASENDGTSGQTIVVLCGVITIANALFNCFVLCNHPAFRKAKEPVPQNDEVRLSFFHPAMVPTSNVLCSFVARPWCVVQEVLAYLDAHPEFALRAVQHVTSGGGSAASAKPKMLSPVDTDRELHSDDTAGQFEPRAASATVSAATTESSSHAARPPRAAPAPPTAAPPPRGPGGGIAPHDERGDAAVPSTGHRRAESAPVAPAQGSSMCSSCERMHVASGRFVCKKAAAGGGGCSLPVAPDSISLLPLALLLSCAPARHGRSHSPPPPPTTGSAVERPVYPATSRGPPPIPQRGAGAGGVRRPPPRPFAAPPADL
jgi:hypothetical protein